MAVGANDRLVRVKRGETGFVIEVALKDDQNQPFNLSTGGTWTVLIVVTEPGETTNLLADDAMALLDQSLYPGKAQYILTADDAILDAADYEVEITAIAPTGDPPAQRKWPKVPGDVFATLRMMPSKYVEAP